jgi:hypothetical protein
LTPTIQNTVTRSTGWRSSQRKAPASSARVHTAGAPVADGRRGRRKPTIASRPATSSAVAIENGASWWMPKVRPARAGPTSSAANGRAALRASAALSCSAGTTCGSAACSAGGNAELKTPSSAAARNTSGNDQVPASRTNTMPSAAAARTPCETSISFLRSHRSATTPAGTLAAIRAAARTETTAATSHAVPPCAMTSSGKAMYADSATSSDTSIPDHRMR